MPDLHEISLYPLVVSIGGSALSTNSVQTLLAISHSIEDTVMRMRLRGTFYAGFQRLSAFLPQMSRFRRLAAVCGEVLVFAVPDVPVPAIPNLKIIELEADAPLAREWFIVVDQADFAITLLTEQIGDTETTASKAVFGRGRDYQGAVSTHPELVAAARRRLDETLARSYTPTQYQPGLESIASAYRAYNQFLVQYLEQRNQQMIGLFNALNERTAEMARLQNLVRTMISQSAWDQAQSQSAAPAGQARAAIEAQHFTVLFSDIEGFTRLSESLPPSDLLYNLNRYLDLLATTVYQLHGDVDKFMGDGMLAFFSEPQQALQAALTLQRRIASFNDQQIAARRPVLRTRIGLATGNCLLAQVGSRDRSEVTLLGDPVNLASRLQAQCPAGGIALDRATFQGCGEPPFVLGLPLTIRGKSRQQMIYEITPEQLNDLQTFLHPAKGK